MAERRWGAKPISLTALRSDRKAIAMFCAYAFSSRYGWDVFCDQTFGDVPAQTASDQNTPRLTTDDATLPGRRAFTQKELRKLFGYMDDLVDREYAAGSRRWLPALRDSIAFKVCCAYGHRRREVAMLDLYDFGPNPHAPFCGDLGAVTIRLGQGHRRIRPPTSHGPDRPGVRMGRRPGEVLDPGRRSRPFPNRRLLGGALAQ